LLHGLGRRPSGERLRMTGLILARWRIAAPRIAAHRSKTVT